MNWKLENIDELGRKKLGNMVKAPPPMAFKKIRKRVAWFSFWSLGAGSILRRYWMIPASSAVIAFLGIWFFSTPKTEVLAREALSKKALTEFGNTIAQNNPSKTLQSEISNEYVLDNNLSASNNTNSYFNNSIAENNNNSSTSNKTNQFVNAAKNGAESNVSSKLKDEKVAIAHSVDSEFKTEPVAWPSMNKLVSIEAGEIKIHYSDVCTGIDNEQTSKRRIGWSLFAGAAFSQTGNYISRYSDYPGIENRFSVSISPAAELRADFGKWFFSTGVQQTTLTNSYGSDQLLWNEHNEMQYQLIDESWNIDSIGYWHYTFVSDSIIHISDSIWAWDVDSLLVQQFDSVLQLKYDTLFNASWKHSLKLVEIPLMLGTTFSVNRFEFGIAAGFGVGYYFKSGGNIYNGLNSSELFSEFPMPTNRFSLAFLARGSATWFLTERMGLEIAPYVRKSLFSPSWSSEGSSSKPFTTGVFVGVRYYF